SPLARFARRIIPGYCGKREHTAPEHLSCSALPIQVAAYPVCVRGSSLSTAGSSPFFSGRQLRQVGGMSRFPSSVHFRRRLFAVASVFSLTSGIAVAPVPPMAFAVEEAQQDSGGGLRGAGPFPPRAARYGLPDLPSGG